MGLQIFNLQVAGSNPVGFAFCEAVAQRLERVSHQYLSPRIDPHLTKCFLDLWKGHDDER
jgi:hypothetical protein